MQEYAGSHILVADDDPTFRLMLRQFLQRKGFDVREAACGKEAVDMFMRAASDLVLMDAEMPGMDGVEACQRICSISGSECSPVLMVTSHDDDDFIARAFAAGASDYILKPINWILLEQRIKHKLRIDRMMQMLQARAALYT